MAMAATAGDVRSGGMTKDERFVILASSLGTVFEWYDFYLYGSLASIIGFPFFSDYPPATRDIFALLAFAAGFRVRPFGAIVFGRVGDIVGRKYTFLVTILIMGLSTFIVGLLPNAATIGIAAPIILIGLRLLQGLALGGEYGGAATYVAEHSPPGKRGYYTSFIQTTATFGLFLSLLVILFTRTILGEADFAVWGWRIPFLVSVILLGVSVVIRLKLNESPIFQKMKDEGKTSKAPLTEAFGNWSNAKIVLVALLGAVMGQGVVWYTRLPRLVVGEVLNRPRSRWLAGQDRRQRQGRSVHRRKNRQPGDYRGHSGCRIPEGGRCGYRQIVESVRHFPSASCDSHWTAVHPSDLRHHGLRPDRCDVGRVVPDQDPLHLDVATLPHRQRMGRRPVARDLVRNRRVDRRHLLRSLVSGNLCGDSLCGRGGVPAGNQERRYHKRLALQLPSMKLPESMGQPRFEERGCGPHRLKRRLRYRLLRFGRSSSGYFRCSSKSVLRRMRACSWKACLETSSVRQVGCARRRPAIPARGGSRRSGGAGATQQARAS